MIDTGVTVLVEPDHFFYGRVTVADVPEIVDGPSPANRLNVSWSLRINTMELDGMSDIEGKTAREAASEFQIIDKSFVTIYRKRLTMHEEFAVEAAVSAARP